MHRGIYINQHDIREYGAKLQMDYAISGGEIENMTNRGAGRSSTLLLRQSREPLEITLPLDIYGKDKRETMDHLTGIMALLTGTFEVDLSDGYAYTCTCKEIGATAWVNDEICSVDITLSGFKHGEPMRVSGTAPLRVYNPGTWPKTDCKLTIRALSIPAGTLAIIRLFHATELITEWTLTPLIGYITGGDLVLDGQGMQNLYNGGNLRAGTMRWTDYPYLTPGENVLDIECGTASVAATVEFTPTFL